MTLLVSYCRADRFDTSFAFFRSAMNKWRIKRLINWIHFNQFEKDIKGKIVVMLWDQNNLIAFVLLSILVCHLQFWINIYQVINFPIIDLNLPFYLIFINSTKINSTTPSNDINLYFMVYWTFWYLIHNFWISIFQVMNFLNIDLILPF